MAQERFLLVFLAVFAVVAVALASSGVYGVMAYVVSQRAHEIGVRMALGAAGHTMLRMIVVRAMALAVAGLTLGLLAASTLGGLGESLLFEVRPTHPFTLVFGSSALLGVAILAAYVPARRAARVDPMIALRHD